MSMHVDKKSAVRGGEEFVATIERHAVFLGESDEVGDGIAIWMGGCNNVNG